MYDYTRLGSVVSFWLLAAVFCGVGWGVDWRAAEGRVFWVGLILRFVGIVFASWALVTSADWLSHHLAERWRELGNARVVAIVRVADAIKGLNGNQLEFVERLEPVTMEMIVAESSPVFLVRVPGGTVPFDAVEEFLLLCKRSDPYLYPERDFANWRQAQAITKLIVMQGWAQAASGPLPAKLLKPLEWVGERFGVVIGSQDGQDG